MYFKIIITRLTLFIFLCCVAIGITTAEEISQVKRETGIYLSLSNVPVVSVIEAVSKQTEYKFFYDESHLSQLEPVTIKVEDATLQQVLEQISGQTGHEFRKVDDMYIVTPAVQPGNQITGTVVDKDGFPIPGVTIRVKERPGVGVATDSEGRYSIQCGPNETLVFSFIGFKTLERVANEINKVTVTIEEDAIAMDEVVVVAFGKQKKESVISSITTINPSELKVPSSNLTTAFAGRMSGIIAYQRSGEPGLDNAEFFIRGITSFSAGGKKDPLILIDGIEMSTYDLARVNPDDISSFSVMKDANAAALYGARGANGVILVTTKEGVADKLSINVRAELSTSANTELVQLADPITFMRMRNEARITRNTNVTSGEYSDEKIYYTELGTDPIRYPAVDWYDYLLKNRTFNQRVSANISGGGKAVQYYVSANYQHDSGILKENEANKINTNIDINRVQLRSNVTLKISPQTKGMLRFYGSFDDSKGPRQGGAEVFYMARNATPVRFLPYYPKDEANEYTEYILFGMSGAKLDYVNPLASIISGYMETKASTMLTQMELEHLFDGKLKGLFARATVNLKRDANYDLARSYTPFYYAPVNTLDGSYQLTCFNPLEGTDYLDYGFGHKNVYTSMYGEARIGYNKLFAEKHDLNVLLVGSIRTATNTEVTSIEQSLPNRNISTAGRLAYGYDSRYFIEGNFGYNGSERFADKYRYGFFPSFGVGWMVSNEAFMSGTQNVISKLKFKATYGLVGNDGIGYAWDRFFYLSRVNMSDGGMGATFGTEMGYYRPGVSIYRYANDQITWEVAKKFNAGVEIGLFKDLEIIADFFTERRENILQERTHIPSTMGLLSIPQANVGIAEGKGFEAEVKYQKNFTPDIWLVVNGNFTYATAKYVKYEEPAYPNAPWLSMVGQKLKQPWGYIAERLFIDDAEVNNSPVQAGASAGDIKYKDIDNDGIISTADMVPIGYPTVPEIIYGAGFSFGLYGFDISCFFQGSARSSFFIEPLHISPFVNWYQLNDRERRGGVERGVLQYIADDYWSEENRNLHAFWPRLSENVVENNNKTSTKWLQNGAFLRLKTAEIGYTIPERISKKAGMSMLRVYVSGINLLLWSKFKMWDPEMAGNGLGYPIQRVYNVGLNVNF